MATTTPYHPLTLPPPQAKLGHRYVWELPIRLTHFTIALAISTLIITGFFITYPVMSPTGTPEDHFLMGRFRQFHFGAGYLLLLSFITRTYFYFNGNKYSRSGMPRFWNKAWWGVLLRQIVEYMKVERGHAHLGHNSLAAATYVFCVGGVGTFQILTGFAMYGESNPGGFWDKLCGWVIPILGGSFRTRTWHHLSVWVFILFIMAHLYMVIFGSLRFRNGLISSMVSGDKFYRDGDIDYD